VTPYFERAGIVIYHGRAEEVLPMLKQGFSAVVTDPPYQSLDAEVSKGTTTRLVRRDVQRGKPLAALDGLPWFDTLPPDQILALLEESRALLVDDGALYVFADVKSGMDLFPPLKPANVLVWDKGAIGMGRNWRRMHEWVAFCPKPKHRVRDDGLGDILRFTGVANKVHPTEKPVSLLRVLLRNSTDPGDSVLDLFMGSGSTLRAAADLGRLAVGIEPDERQCEVAARRLDQMPLFTEAVS
jgi:site-specific DNA-methyltransferase (adenine-specific)